jgi:hypothetical protein
MYPMLSSPSRKVFAWADCAGPARVGRGAGRINTTPLPLCDLT